MTVDTNMRWVAFSVNKRIAIGDPPTVAAKVKAAVDAVADATVQIFDVPTSRPIEIDLRGRLPAILKRVATTFPPIEPDVADSDNASPRGRGRPKLGVTAREVTLLPRHWDWLAAQPGGASIALRKLVEQARRATADADRIRDARESVYRFMTAMAGNAPNYEEATRMLFAGNVAALTTLLAKWPRDVREHVLMLAEFTEPATKTTATDV